MLSANHRVCNSKQERTGSSTHCLIRCVFIVGNALLFALHSEHTPLFAWPVHSNIQRSRSFVQVQDFSATHGDLHSTLMVCDWGRLKSAFASLDESEHTLCACCVGVFTLTCVIRSC